MLEVLCSESELAEYGQVVEVGQSVRRLGVQSPQVWFGTGLDRIEHRFDRYAEVVGGLPPVAIAGEVAAIAAIHCRLAGDGRHGEVRWGSAVLEPLTSTDRTRRPIRRIRVEPEVVVTACWTVPKADDGDEMLWGWRFTLADAIVEPWPSEV